MHELGNKRDYLPIFEVDGFNLLLSDLIMQSYGKYGQVELCEQGHIREFSNQTRWVQSSQEGLELFASDSNTSSFLGNLKQLFSENTDSMAAIASSEPSRDSISNYFQLAKEMLDQYVKMSPMFTDEAYKQSEQNPSITRNLSLAEQAKERFRARISELFLEEGSHLARLVAAISKKDNIREDALWWLTIQELKESKLASTIDERQAAFIQIGESNNVTNYFGDRAVEQIRNFDSSASPIEEVSGMVASLGNSITTRGRVIVINIDYANMTSTRNKMEKMQQGDIMVSQTTSPELTAACGKAAAIITDVGGMLSHAAIVSRELSIPCIVGTRDASKIFKDGDIVVVNTEDGTVQLAG